MSQERLGEHYSRYSSNPWIASNFQQFQGHSTDQVFTPAANQQRSLVLEPSIQYDYYVKYLVIRSQDRDVANYPQPQQYRINFDNTAFRNIYSIELVSCIIPDKSNVTNEPYLLLDIPELRDEPMECVNTHVSNAFTLLQLAPAVKSGHFISIDKQTHESTIKYYHTPKARLDHLTINIKDVDGNLFDFGDDTAGSPPNKSLQNIFVFKITTREKSQAVLNQRSVY